MAQIPLSTQLANLTTELADELAGFVDYTAACDAINGRGGIRARYLSRANAFAAAGHTGPNLAHNGGLLCEQTVARLAPVQCATTGWTSLPISSLKENLKMNIRIENGIGRDRLWPFGKHSATLRNLETAFRASIELKGKLKDARAALESSGRYTQSGAAEACEAQARGTG